MDEKKYAAAGKELYEQLHLATYPIAVKYIGNESEIPSGFMRPTAMKQKWTICQAFTYVRRWGWSVALTSDDIFCTPALYSFQWTDITVEEVLESQLLQRWHKDAEAEKRRLAHGAAQMTAAMIESLKEYHGMICMPLQETKFEPDTVLIMGNGENITHVIQALTYNGENYPVSTFEGFGETCMKGALLPFVSGIPQVVIPGTGDRTFSGVHDYEIGIGMPGKLVLAAVENLFLTGGRQNMGQPVKTFLAMGLTEKITPGFQYLRDRLDRRKK